MVEYTPDVWQVEDSYPFGWSIKYRSFTHPNPEEAYRFGFNGKENDKDFGNQLIQDYGFRLYNPAIAKFLSVDPLAPSYPDLTTYQFASNSPISGSDLDGLEYLLEIYPNTSQEREAFIGILNSGDIYKARAFTYALMLRIEPPDRFISPFLVRDAYLYSVSKLSEGLTIKIYDENNNITDEIFTLG